jgi:hypothetical protein
VQAKKPSEPSDEAPGKTDKKAIKGTANKPAGQV